MKETTIISGFPGVGKTEFFKDQKYHGRVCLDSDSSEFSWVKDENGNNTKERNPEFPKNYIEHIKSNIGKVDVIFVSSHKVVREALEKEGLNYYLVYPKREDKTEYIRRYRKRGNEVCCIWNILQRITETVRGYSISVLIWKMKLFLLKENYPLESFYHQ